MNRHQARMLEDWLDGPRARHHRRQQAKERREALVEVLGALLWLGILFVLFWALS